MDKIPLIDLHRLINERRLYALDGNIEAVEALNQMIKRLLAL